MKIRRAEFADQFYPGDMRELVQLLENIYRKEKDRINCNLAKNNIIGGIVPHAGYIYSGYEAIHFFEIIKYSSVQYDTIIIINPNHSGYGADISLDTNDAWETPLGIVEIDKEFSDKLNIPKSEYAHKHEHSGEVMLPYLQYWLDYDFKIVPICILRQDISNGILLADKIFQANRLLKRKILVLASSDFSHFVSPEFGKRRDDMVLEKIFDFDSEEVYKIIKTKSVSVCGYCPIMALIEYSKLVAENPKAEILKQGHSGEVMPSEEVVDYVSVLFYKE
jgi:AmmeMemoRadiSam system protein B